MPVAKRKKAQTSKAAPGKSQPAKKTPARASKPQPVIEYPKEGETVASYDYTLRIALADAADVEDVEVSFNQGPWLSCRPAIGFWWYDWAAFEPGEYVVVARAKTAKGHHAGKPRSLRVAR